MYPYDDASFNKIVWWKMERRWFYPKVTDHNDDAWYPLLKNIFENANIKSIIKLKIK